MGMCERERLFGRGRSAQVKSLYWASSRATASSTSDTTVTPFFAARILSSMTVVAGKWACSRRLPMRSGRRSVDPPALAGLGALKLSFGLASMA